MASKQPLRGVLMLTAAMAVASGLPARADTLADALVKAYQTSPQLDAGRAALRGIDENVPQARASRRPQLDGAIGGSISGDLDELDRKLYDARAALNASLLIFDSGATRAGLEAARNAVAAGRADLKDIEQTVLYNAVAAYADVRRDQEFVTLANNDVRRLNETLDATRNRFDVGEVTRTDVSQSEARLAESRSSLAAARGALSVSQASYVSAVGAPPRDLAPLPSKPALPKSVAEAQSITLKSNPQLIAAQFDERVAVYDFDRSIAAKRPSVTARANAGVRRGNAYPPSIFGTATDDVWSTEPYGEVSIEGSMPLYDGGRNDSLVRQAQALLDQRRYQVQLAGRSVSEAVATSWAELESARAAIVARREQAEAARIAADGVAEEARLGARSTIEVLDADQDLLEAQAQIVQALRDEYVATYGVLRAMGLLTVEHLNLGIPTYDPEVNFDRVQAGPLGGYDTSAVDRIRARWEK